MFKLFSRKRSDTTINKLRDVLRTLHDVREDLYVSNATLWDTADEEELRGASTMITTVLNRLEHAAASR